MTKNFLFLFVFSISICSHRAQTLVQDTTTKKIKFSYGGMQQFGLVFTENATYPAFSVSNGVRFSRFYTGLGADIMFYKRNYYYASNSFNIAAVYADGRYYLNKKKKLFTKAAVGINYITDRFPQRDTESYKKLIGYYTAFGFGFKAKLSSEVNYSFDICYLIRQTRFNHTYFNFLKEAQTDKYDLRQYSIVVNMGLEIF